MPPFKLLQSTISFADVDFVFLLESRMALSPPLGPDDFHFISAGNTEEIARYVPGGYHPVIIGDILQSTARPQASSYRILHKLGFGSYATVWLAERGDTSNTFVALKVTTAKDRSTSEVEFLEHVQKTPSPNIVSLLDAFDLQGPNGLHSVLVTEVLVPVISFFASTRPMSWRKKVAHDLVQGVAHLHASDVVHGDLHLGNVGIAVPELAKQDSYDLMQDISAHDLTIVLPVDSKNASPSFPAYLVAPCKMATYYDRIVDREAEPQAKIFDFGSAHFSGTNPKGFQCALEACPPETVFARVVVKVKKPPVEPPADVWALAAMIYELMSGSSLFYGVGMGSVLTSMISMAGTAPSYWEGRWPEPSRPDPDSWWHQRRGHLEKYCPDEQSTELLIKMLRKMLVLDPSNRPSAAEICQDEWFKNVCAIYLYWQRYISDHGEIVSPVWL